MGTTMAGVVLRPVTGADREFLVGVYAATREEELSQVPWPEGQREAFISMQFDAQDTAYRSQNPRGSFDVIELDGRPVGRLYVDRRPGEIRIVDIALLPAARGSGIGSALIARLCEEAGAAGCDVSIHVEQHNRAAELYARLGFRVVGESGIYRRMEWSAP